MAAELISRFAPSPTGRLHLGHAFSALLAHDLARARGGRFLLRIEDIDAGRCRHDHIEGIVEDLRWLGLHWDGEIVFQSGRLALYHAACDRLRADGLLYPCFCTRAQISAEIGASASAPHGPYGPIYPGSCKRLLRHQVELRLAAGAPHAWRLDVAEAAARVGPLSWHDRHAGEVPATPELHGDVVLARKDAPTSYHLAVTVDDAAQGVTDVIRGEDLFAATHVHRLLQALLGLPTPAYHHHRLLADAGGERLAKRRGSPTLASMRADGADPTELLRMLRGSSAPFAGGGNGFRSDAPRAKPFV